MEFFGSLRGSLSRDSDVLQKIKEIPFICTRQVGWIE
jgi:hypothetical protein